MTDSKTWFLTGCSSGFGRASAEAALAAGHRVAWVHDKTTNAEWRVQFVWPFRASYLAIDPNDDYEWAVIGYPARKLAWLLSRKPTLDEKTCKDILQRMRQQGYDPARPEKVPQRIP